jgi:hypothetical protein
MFGTDLLISIAIGLASLIGFLLFTVLSQAGAVGVIIGGLFALVIAVAIAVLGPILIYTVNAVYYDKISKENPK